MPRGQMYLGSDGQWHVRANGGGPPRPGGPSSPSFDTSFSAPQRSFGETDTSPVYAPGTSSAPDIGGGGGFSTLDTIFQYGLPLVRAGLDYFGSKRAADVEQQTANQSADLERQFLQEIQRQYDQSRTDTAPWRTAGSTAVGQLTNLTSPTGEFSRPLTLADFTESPDYQFRLGEGEKAINNARAAGGGYVSGATAKSLARFAEGLGSEEFNNWFSRMQTDRTNRFNRLADIAGLGQTATANLTNAGSADLQTAGSTTGGIASNILAGGQARAAGAKAGYDALGSGIDDILKAYYAKKLGVF